MGIDHLNAAHFRTSRYWQLAIVLSLCLQTALGFVWNEDSSGNRRRWVVAEPLPSVSTNVFNPVTKSIRYFLAAEGYSKTNTTAELNAVRACFDQWQSVPRTSLKFEEGGFAGLGADINTSDETNVIFWARESTLVNGGRDSIFGTLAITYPRLTANNILLEADIVLNGAQFSWFTDFNATNITDQFSEGSILHEIGHFIGLDHSPVGGATMFPRGLSGINSQAGLSSDEMAAARAIYPGVDQAARFGHLRGQVLMNGRGIWGAAVFLEDATGHLACGTITQTSGSYELPSLEPGNYQVRVTPLDPATNNSLRRLLIGAEISPAFAGAETTFLPTTNMTVMISATATNTLALTVNPGNPQCRITRIARPALDAADLAAINAPAILRLGESNVLIGVYSPDLPSESTLAISGSGVNLGPSKFTRDAFPGSNPSLNLLSATVQVLPAAPPGLRSLVVQSGTNIAYANGYLEILPRFPDFNFDRLDDRFQRAHFERFTSAEAGPQADPDRDGFENFREYVAGSDPRNSRSLLKIEKVELTAQGNSISWQSEPGKQYRVFGRSRLGADLWQPISSVIIANAKSTTYLDSTAADDFRFYQVQVLP